MSESAFKYAIVGGGPAGASAAQGIRELDADGSIVIFGSEPHIAYDRAPLSKQLWLGGKRIEDIFVHPQSFYDDYSVTLRLNTRVERIWPDEHLLSDSRGNNWRFEKLLLATGGLPRRLEIQNANAQDFCHFRCIDDYLRMRKDAVAGTSVTVVGGGSIGSEIAASMNLNHVHVTMVFPENYLCSTIFPADLGRAVQSMYDQRGVTLIPADLPASVSRRAGKLITLTRNANYVESDCILVAIGIVPDDRLAREAGIQIADGIVVNEFLETSAPGIYAAGDNAFFPYLALGRHMRVEHWDNAINQGHQAGRNMAGAREQYNHIPYFFSSLFEFGFEAVGDTNPRLETVADWQMEFDTGTIYYVQDGKVRGVLMCNMPGKLDEARDLVRRGAPVPERLQTLIA